MQLILQVVVKGTETEASAPYQPLRSAVSKRQLAARRAAAHQQFASQQEKSKIEAKIWGHLAHSWILC